MDLLWAPWRMEYIDAPKTSGCVFCAMQNAAPQSDDLMLWRGDSVFCVMNRYPYNPGHIMVVLHEHTDQLSRVSAAAQQEFIWLFGQAMDIVRTVLQADGINAGVNVGLAAGAGVINHLHFHIVPRWQGDTNFLPVLGTTRAMPEYLTDTYRQLAPAFAGLKQGA